MPFPTTLRHLRCALLVTAFSIGIPGETLAQVLSSSDPIPAGSIRLWVAGVFRTSSGRLGDAGAFADDLTAPDALMLLGDAGNLAPGLTALLGSPAPDLVSGSTTGAVRVTQTRVPMTIEVGVLDRLQLRGTVPMVRSRLEAELGFLASPDANLGRSPVYESLAQIQDFVAELESATDGFEGGTRDWGAWVAAWRAAYSAAPLFPTADSDVAVALLAELDALNAALVEAGRDPVASLPSFAVAPLTASDVDAILRSAPFAVTSFDQAPYVWRLGDVEFEGRFLLIPAPAGLEVTLTGGVRLPTGSQADPDLPYMLPSDPATLAFWGGGEAWLRGDRWTLGGGLQATMHGESEIIRRISPVDIAFPASVNRTLLGWTPGSILTADVIGEWSPAPLLRLALGYRLEARGEDSWERRGPIPSIDPGLFPTGVLYDDASVLEAGTAGSRHWVHGGFRWLPPQARGFEISFDAAATVAGSGDRILDETRVHLGASRALSIW